MRDNKLALAGAVATVLASLALSVTMQDGRWLWPSWLVIAVVVGCSWLARRFAAPTSLVFMAGFVGLLLALTFGYARDEALFWFIPGPAAWDRFGQLIREGGTTISESAPPAPTTTGLIFLTATGIGFVALLVDTCAVTLRSAAVAGLPLFALYAVPSAVVAGGAPLLYFLLGAIGYLGLLMADGRARLGGWGRVLTRRSPRASDKPEDVGSGEAIGLVGRRIGAAALGAAIVVPAVLPSLYSGLVSGSGPGHGHGNGARTIITVNPLVSLQRDLTRPDDREILRYTTDNSSPDYLRMVTLDSFDGVLWQPPELKTTSAQRVSRGMPDPFGLGSDIKVTKVKTRIAVSVLDENRLPLPYPTTGITIKGDWRWEFDTRNVLATDKSRTRGSTYQVNSLGVQPTVEELRKAPGIEPTSALQRYISVPQSVSDSVRRTARQVTQGAATDFDRAMALQTWFRTNFTYDTKPVPDSQHPLDDFLDSKRGYCQQFAATMAVMARLVGIPARVDVGFAPGKQQKDGSWSVSWSDTHAWPELYFTGIGWVRFEPTPRSDAGVGTPLYATPTAANAGNPQGPNAGPSASASASGAANPADRTREDREARLRAQQAAGANSGILNRHRGKWYAGGVLVVILLALPATARAVQRRRRLRPGRDAASIEDAWAEVRDSARDLGHAWPVSETPRATSARVRSEAHLDTNSGEALDRVARSVERARYARDPGTVADLAPDVQLVRAAMLGQASRGRRLLARAMPPSAWSFASWTGERVADVLDAIDTAWSRVRGRFARA